MQLDIIKKHLAQHYQLGDQLAIEPIKAGVENSNYLVSTTTAQYVFRIYNNHHSIRGERNIAQIELELEFTNEVIMQGIPAPQVINSKQGNRILTIRVADEDRSSALFALLPGSSPKKFTSEIAMELGNAVNIIMQAGKKFENQDVLNSEHNIINRSKKYFSPLQQDTRLKELISVLADQEKDLVKAQLPLGLVHGDIKLENILFEDNQLTGILDFDDFRFSYLLEDVVMTMMHNLHSTEENLLRSGFVDLFLKELNSKEFEQSKNHLKTLLRFRFVYDCSKYLANDLYELVSELFEDDKIQEYILN